MNSRRALEIARWMLACGALAAIVLTYQRWLHVNPTTVALTLLLLILVLAAEWGLRYAVVIAVISTACYNFFFLPPVGTFTISDPQNWLALIAFLLTAILASRLSQRARDRTDDARKRQAELEILFRLSRELLQTESVLALVSSIPSAVASVTGARSAFLYLLEGDRIYRAGRDLVSEIEIPHLRRLSESLGSVGEEADEIQIPLRSGVRPRGLLLLRGVSISSKTSEAMGGLISIALDRAQALEVVARSEAAKQSERMRTLMIDSITHELRTPLTSIKGAAKTLLSGNISAEDNLELLTIIDEESDRLNRLVGEAVEMAQLDAQQVQMHFGKVNLRDLIAAAVKNSAWVEEAHPMRFEIPAELEAQADPEFLTKVISNLLENAAKYSEAGQPITVSAEQADGGVRVSVADRGIGIDPQEQGLIFERFYRARSRREETPGSGMGLAISRSIMEAHGGRIDIASQLGQGSVFTITIPMRNQPAES